jgi:hypothetical protein
MGMGTPAAGTPTVCGFFSVASGRRHKVVCPLPADCPDP